MSGWGVKFFDYDNDGAIDLIQANGHPDDMIENYSQQVKYKEPLLLFHQEEGRLKNVSTQAGPAFQRQVPCPRSCYRRLQQRGRIDVLIGNNAVSPCCFRTSPARAITGSASNCRDSMQPRCNRRERLRGPLEA